jgi:thiamine biosynthesis lipoprotein
MTDELRRRSFSAMGTICSVAATAERRDAFLAAGALDAARAEVAACERILSRFDPGSDLSRLNSAAGDWVAVDIRLLEALTAALRGRTLTHGRFDPMILPALTAAGYDRSFERLTETVAVGLDGWHAGARVEIDADSGSARIEQGAAADLGGIGKGFSATRALEAMRVAWPALMGGLVDLGGDIAVWGSPPEGGHWRIDIADPREHENVLGTLEIPHGGVATSGRDTRRFGPRQQLHHLIDPATGGPGESGPLSVTVTATNATDAEVYATALGVTAVEDARELLAIRPDIAALLIPQFGDPVTVGHLPLAPNRPTARALVNTQVGQFQWQ